MVVTMIMKLPAPLLWILLSTNAFPLTHHHARSSVVQRQHSRLHRLSQQSHTVLLSTMSNNPLSHSLPNDDDGNKNEHDEELHRRLHHHDQVHEQQKLSSRKDEYRSLEFSNGNFDAVSPLSSSSLFSNNLTSSLRQQRIQREYNIQQQFVPYSNALWELREKCNLLQVEIQQYVEQIKQHNEQGNPVRPFILDRVLTLEKKLDQLQQQDPEYVYHTSIQQLGIIRRKQELLLQQHQQQQLTPRQVEKRREKYALLCEKYQTQIASAKSCLPQYNYHGLWIGKYGNNPQNGANEYDVINITYVGNEHQDMMIATKVTSYHGNVPMDEITFQVPLYPVNPISTSQPSSVMSSPKSNAEGGKSGVGDNVNGVGIQLPPIPLSPNAASKWGISKLSRFYGYGQVAEQQYQNHHWVPGQFIVINQNYFSFAWLPTPSAASSSSSVQSSDVNPQEQQTQIFFGRPSPELVLKLLAKKNTNSYDLATATTKNPNDDSNIVHQIMQQQQQDKAKEDDNVKRNPNASAPKQDDYEFPSITAKRILPPSSYKNSLQYQREHASRCMDLTYEQILDEIDVQYHNPYGNGIWHHCLDENGDDDQCYFE